MAGLLFSMMIFWVLLDEEGWELAGPAMPVVLLPCQIPALMSFICRFTSTCSTEKAKDHVFFRLLEKEWRRSR